MSLDTFIVFHPDTNQWVPACDSYLIDTRKFSDEELNHLYNRSNTNTQEILNKHGMSLDSCEYHKIMECAEEVEETIKINLEEFVDKEVVITTNSDVIREGWMKKGIHPMFPYELHCFGYGPILYNREGYNYEDNLIKHIELKQPQQPQKAMTPLSNSTIEKLADALTDDAIKYLELDEEYIETLVSVIGRFLTDRMGQMDDTLLNGLSFIIFDNFDITSNIK